MSLSRFALCAGSIAGGLAVVLGAFGAHALRGVLDDRALAIWHTAVEYQFWHALALLAVGVMALERVDRWSRVAAACFVVGSALFSGSLYALAVGAPHWTGVITPFGGLALICGWIALGVHAWRTTDP
jgi:uncharacterized membrane protein YgdD (TMEM256/DUF423 family)